MVAGDDCVAFVHQSDALPFQQAFEQYVASPDKVSKTHGLGQVISNYFIREWWNIDFCSKFAVHANGGKGFEGMYLLRDPVKFIETKHYYNGRNPVLRRSAHLHAEAMLECAKIEMPIPALIDYLFIRLAKYRNEHSSEPHLDVQKYFESVQKQHRLWNTKISSSHINAVEQRVLQRIGFSMSTLARIQDSGVILLGNRPSCLLLSPQDLEAPISAISYSFPASFQSSLYS